MRDYFPKPGTLFEVTVDGYIKRYNRFFTKKYLKGEIQLPPFTILMFLKHKKAKNNWTSHRTYTFLWGKQLVYWYCQLEPFVYAPGFKILKLVEIDRKKEFLTTFREINVK